MFLGEYKTSFSGLGRVILPKKIRIELSGGNTVILTKGFERCIFGYSREEFEKLAKVQLEESVTEETARNMRRFLFSGSEEAKLDAQGRFVISGSLLKYAKLKKEVYVIGAGDHFEVWDSKSWKSYLKGIEEGYAKLP